MKKRVLSIFLIMTLFISVAAPVSFAASGKTKKMTVYKVVKKGNYCYCNPDYGKHIYRVNVKAGKIKKYNIPCYTAFDFKIYKGYLYYVSAGSSYDDWRYDYTLYRMNLKTGKSGKLFHANYCHDEENFAYAISKSKLYVQAKSIDTDFNVVKNTKKVMKVNGKSKKNSKVKVKNLYKNSNSKGYTLYEKYVDGYGTEFSDPEDAEIDEPLYVEAYLKTPKDMILLTTYEYEED